MIAEAWLFGRLASLSQGFIYLGQGGFLRSLQDAREFEFAFLKARGKGLCCYFTGNDIRSIPKMAEQEVRLGIPNIATYLTAVSPIFLSKEYDLLRMRIAESADKYADVIFTAAQDQEGYLTRETRPFRYFFPDDEIVEPGSRFDSSEPLVVLHAPSSPIIKGTQLVRAAVTALRREGFEFEYIELSGVSHARVKRELRRAHIVLNEFFSYMPGVFGVEAMATGAVLVTSADERIETDLPVSSNEAWVATSHFEVTQHLRQLLLASRSELRMQAERGQLWVRTHATASVSGRVIRRELDAVLSAIVK